MTVQCRNPLCKVSLVSATGVALRAGPLFIGHFCKPCSEKIQTGTKIGMQAAGIAALTWAQQKHPYVVKLLQDAFSPRLNGR